METRKIRSLALAAGLAWLVVAGYGLREVVVDDESWQVAYAVYSFGLLVGAALAMTGVALATADTGRPRLRIAGLIVGGLGCAFAAVGAWALPVWMTLLGSGLAMVAGAAEAGRRRVLILMAAGQLTGIAVLIAAIEAQIGRRDAYGDYPAAGGIAVLVVAAVMIAALVGLVRELERQGDESPVLGVSAAT